MGVRYYIVGLLTVVMVNGQIALPPGIVPNLEPADPCKDIKNKSVIDMPKHKYMVVEHCLYYSLQRDIDSKAKQPNAIALLPPPREGGTDGEVGNITVNIYGITLQSIWLMPHITKRYHPCTEISPLQNEMLKDLRVRGFVPVSWKDPRLTWDPKEWKISDMGVQTAAHLWVPQLSSEKHDTSLVSGDTIDYKRLRVSNSGNVSGLMIFNLQTFCDVDFHNFPSDVHACCAQLEPTFYDNIINFKISNSAYTVDTRFIKNTGYQIDKVVMQTYTTQESAMFQFCVHLIRSNTTLHVELAVPMAICAILILFAPLFGSLKAQLHVKLFALLLQYLCLQFLANKMTYLGNGSTPRIFRFYEFTIVMNLISLLVTVFVAAANRAERNLPPAQSLMSTSTFINKFCFCMSVVDDMDDSHTASPGEEKKYARDWRAVFSAVHSILMTIVVIVYLIGVSVIYT